MRWRLTAGVGCVSVMLAATSVVAAAPTVLPQGVTPRPSPTGLVLTGADGRPLYHLDFDRVAKRRRLSRGRDLCTDACRRLWRPATAPAGFAPDGDWGVAMRADGTRQLTYKGDPLYSFTGKTLAEAADLRVFPPWFASYSAPPASMVDGVPMTSVYWHEADYRPPPPDVAAPGGVAVSWAKLAYVFTDAGDHPLYVSTAATDCGDRCAGLQPLAAPLVAYPVGPWRPVQAADGGRYWSYGGQVVYRGEADTKPDGDWIALAAR